MTEKQGGESGFEMGEGKESRETALPDMTFSMLVLSLSTSAMVHLGASPEPQSGGAPEVNLPLAKQTIDILEMLAEKTVGNLEPDEQSLLDNVLHEVHKKYLEGRKARS
jgi:hypothetical protein